MDFVIQWLCYLLAFVAGSGLASLTATSLKKRSSRRASAAGMGETSEVGVWQ